MIDLYDLGDGRATQRRVTLESAVTGSRSSPNNARTSTRRSKNCNPSARSSRPARRSSRKPPLMPTYRAPVKDTQFVLSGGRRPRQLFEPAGLRRRDPRYRRGDPRRGREVLRERPAPLNLRGDQQGCTRHADGSVTPPPGFKAAYERSSTAGWGTLTADPEHGGQGLPHVVGTAIAEYLSSANMAFSMYPGPERRRAGGDPRGRLGRAEAHVPAEDGRGPLDRHDEPDRAAVRAPTSA